MLVLQVLVRVKPECLDAFRAATVANAEASRKEAGVARFDVLQQEDDPTRFQLVEVYRSRDASAAHKETAHYRQWVEAVGPLMAEARTRTWWTSVSPADEAWQGA